ncbi:hypothetical protein ACPEEZ_04375 [Frigoribacterium sp. 2-23]|uniref:hypothetical protein n=1 Tax=Frigoribacterium sp. 2-23 TaxID=3415006 RepID=UPI003C6ED7F2
MTTRWARFARGWFVAVASVIVASVSHVCGGGMDPGDLGVVLSLAFAVPLCIALSGRRLSIVRLAVSVALSQVVFHLLFSLGASTGGVGATGGHHEALVVTADGTATTVMDMPTAAMTIAHAVAAVLTIAALHRGDVALQALARLAGGRLTVARLLLAVVRPGDDGRRARPVVVRRVDAHVFRFLTARPHRGPPRLV